jgi:hypothetical protein
MVFCARCDTWCHNLRQHDRTGECSIRRVIRDEFRALVDGGRANEANLLLYRLPNNLRLDVRWGRPVYA